VISVALKTPLEIRLGICIYKTSLLQTKATEPAGMARKTKLSPSAEMLKSTPLVRTASGELQTGLLIGFAKHKDTCRVATQLSLYSNLKVTT